VRRSRGLSKRRGAKPRKARKYNLRCLLDRLLAVLSYVGGAARFETGYHREIACAGRAMRTARMPRSWSADSVPASAC